MAWHPSLCGLPQGSWGLLTDSFWNVYPVFWFTREVNCISRNMIDCIIIEKSQCIYILILTQRHSDASTWMICKFSKVWWKRKNLTRFPERSSGMGLVWAFLERGFQKKRYVLLLSEKVTVVVQHMPPCSLLESPTGTPPAPPSFSLWSSLSKPVNLGVLSSLRPSPTWDCAPEQAGRAHQRHAPCLLLLGFP